MKSQLVRRITAGASSLVSCALLLGAVNAQSQTTNVSVNPTLSWQGYMNVFDLPQNGGAYEFGSGWGTAALPAVFNGSILTLSPNVNTYNASDPYWTNPDGSGNKICDASFYVQDDTIAGDSVTFSGYCATNTLNTNYTSVAFIKDFSAGYSLNGSISIPFTNGMPFTISLDTFPGDHIQYGFETMGPDANPATVSTLGMVQVSTSVAAPPPPGTPTNNAPTPTHPAANVLSLYNSSGVYSNHPVERFLAAWSGSAGGTYTITNTGRVVLDYIGLQYAGVELYDTASGDNSGGATNYSIDISGYTTMHVDVWTPNANQFAIELVSLNPTTPSTIAYLPASGVITSNHWIGFDIPVSEFVATNSAIDLTDIQQFLWIDNLGGGGVTGGNFYLDNLYFYNAGSAAPTPTITASVSGSTVSLSFPTVSGYSYRVQYKNNLSDATWTTLSTISGDGATHIVTDSASLSHRYYRLH